MVPPAWLVAVAATARHCTSPQRLSLVMTKLREGRGAHPARPGEEGRGYSGRLRGHDRDRIATVGQALEVVVAAVVETVAVRPLVVAGNVVVRVSPYPYAVLNTSGTR